MYLLSKRVSYIASYTATFPMCIVCVCVHLIVTGVVRWCGDHTCKKWEDSSFSHNLLPKGN